MDSNLDHIRHSLAHLLAASVLKKWPDTKLGIGPVIENGFYYDFQFSQPISDADLKDIEKQMRKFVGGKLAFTGTEMTADELKLKYASQPFKLDLISEYAGEGRKLTSYKTGEIFEDLCRGGHVENTSEIDPDSFKLTKLAGAYWRGDEKNAQLTRIYGLAFANKAELDAHLTMLAEAEKRDHRKLGQELDLFTFSPLVGSGLPMFTPRGTLLRQLLTEFVWSLMEPQGYQRVTIPHMAKADLYKTSGHYDKFADDIFHVSSKKSEDEFIMKPMNCPHHTQIYASKPRSYRDLPIRYSEVTAVYRDENTGQLAGLSRVRSITQDDAHIFCTMDQVKHEVKQIHDIVTAFYQAFNMPLRIRLSINDPAKPEKYLGTPEMWNKAVTSLKEVLSDLGKEYELGVGEAAFYGPKIDFMAKDAIGREWQLATAQVDFNQPERFGLEYAAADGTKQRPVMVHRAISGSLERFMAILIEHYAGHFPLWLSPVQARVIAVGEKYQDYASKQVASLKENGIRAELADCDETLGKRIRQAQVEKIPYVLVVGEEELNANTVAVKLRNADLGKMTTADLVEKIRKEIAEKK
jgi:threonyl-tRNA synthetase